MRRGEDALGKPAVRAHVDLWFVIRRQSKGQGVKLRRAVVQGFPGKSRLTGRLKKTHGGSAELLRGITARTQLHHILASDQRTQVGGSIKHVDARE